MSSCALWWMDYSNRMKKAHRSNPVRFCVYKNATKWSKKFFLKLAVFWARQHHRHKTSVGGTVDCPVAPHSFDLSPFSFGVDNFVVYKSRAFCGASSGLWQAQQNCTAAQGRCCTIYPLRDPYLPVIIYRRKP